MSSQTQSEIINICEIVAKTAFAEDLRKPMRFQIFQERSNCQQEFVFLVKKKMKIRDEFLGFVKNDQMDVGAIKAFVVNLNIDSEKYVEQGYDSCSTMTGKDSGVQILQKNCTFVVRAIS